MSAAFFPLLIQIQLILFFLFFFVTVFLHLKTRQAHKFYKFWLISLFGTVFFLGYLSYYHSDHRHQKNHYTHFIHTEGSLYVHTEIVEVLKPTKFYYRYVGKVYQVNQKHTSGKILVKVPKTASELNLNMRLHLLLSANRLMKIPKALQPYAFDYAVFMAHKNIFHQINLDHLACRIDRYEGKSFLTLAQNLREHIKTYFKENIRQKSIYNMSVALLLGEKQNLSPSIYNDFKQSGTVHILAISGLHIGILLLFLNFVFKPLKNKYPWLFLFLILLFLWFYAFLTGFSPSVLRAVMMFSFLQIGLMRRRQSNIYNSLFVAAFFMLIVQPQYIFRVGFQMSFIAVLSIISFYPIFSRCCKVQNKFLQWFIDLFWVSLAAQLGVLPFTIFYFHQFPVYFFLANLFTIPLLFLILFLGFILIVLSFGSLNITVLFKIFTVLLHSLLQINFYIAHLPHAVIAPIRMSVLQLVLSILGLVILFYFFKTQQKYQAWVFLGLWIISFQLLCIFKKYKISQSPKFYIFQNYKTSISGLDLGSQIIIYGDSLRTNSFLWQNLSQHFSDIHLHKALFYQTFKEYKILYVNNTGIFRYQNFHPDIVVIQHSPKINPYRLLLHLHPKILIADGSNYPSVSRGFEQAAKQLKISFYNTAKKGTFVLK